MRIGRALAIALLLSACTGPAPGPSAPSAPVSAEPPPSGGSPSAGPQLLELVSRANGWVLQATADARTGRNRENYAGFSWWLGPDRALVEWRWYFDNAFYVADLGAGSITPLKGYESIRSVAPDGRHLIDHLSGAGVWLKEFATGQPIYQLPGKDPQVTWLTPTLLSVTYDRNMATVYDLATGQETPLPDAAGQVVLMADREVCYPHFTIDQVSCVPLDGGEPRPIAQLKVHPDAYDPTPLLAVSPDGRHLAILYAKAPFLSWRLTPVARAFDAPDTRMIPWANDLAVYDANTKQVTHYPFGREYRSREMLWSADGSYLALALGDMKRRGSYVTTLERTEFWVLNLATGRTAKAAEAKSANAQLRMVTDQGAVIYQVEKEKQLLVASPQAKPRAWAPGLTVLPGPAWRQPPEPVALIGKRALEVRMDDGTVYRWGWEGKDAKARPSVGPGAEWVVLHFDRGDEMVFLKR
jgi:hypothetical protein